MASLIKVNLDTNKKQYALKECKQNDDLFLEATILENGIYKDLSKCTILIQALKSDNTYIIQNDEITKERNKIKANLKRDFTRVYGKTKIEIVLVEAGKQNTVFDFDLSIRKSVIEDVVESENTVTILETLTNKVVKAVQVKEETEELIKNGGAATKGDIQEVNSQLAQKANYDYINIKIGNMGNTKTFKGSCLFSALPTTNNKVDDYWYVTDKTTNYCWNGSSWIDIGNNLNIGEKTITPEKTNFIDVVESSNKLDPTLLTKGFIQNSGDISIADWALAYSYTNKIKCDKNKKIFFTKSGTPSAQIGCVFNGNTFVSAISSIATITSLQDSEGLLYYKIIFNSNAPSFDNIVLNILNESITNKEKLYVLYDLDDSVGNFSINKNYVEYSTKNNLRNIIVPVSEKAKTLDDNYRQGIIDEANPNKVANIIQCWGDSLTRGVGTTNYDTKSYPSVLKSLLGDSYTVNNLGVGGEGIQQISARQGGAYAYVQPVIIPASGSITISLKDSSGNDIKLVQQSGTVETGNGGINPCYINGIKGALTNVSGAMTFTRETNGNSLTLTHQTPLITNAMTNYKNGVLIIWGGTNNRPYINNTPVVEKNEIFNVIKRIKNIINFSNATKYIVVGMTCKSYMPQVVDINKLLSNEFGSNFLDLRTNIITDGLALVGITPTTQDTTDISNGEIPVSLRTDEVHFNDKGYSLIGNYIYEHGKLLGYW